MKPQKPGSPYPISGSNPPIHSHHAMMNSLSHPSYPLSKLRTIKRTCTANDPLPNHFSHSLKLFCRCLEFQFNVREILSIQSLPLRSSGRTLGKGNLDADTVT